jgi:multidrug/hemolysin transport system permease protein
MRLFPPTHAAALFRRILMDAPMAEMFDGAPAGVADDFRVTMGVALKFGDVEVSPLSSVFVLIATAAVFFALALVNMSRGRKA